MNISSLIEGLQILQKHDPNTLVHIHSDCLYCGNFTSIAETISPEDENRLIELGWWESEESYCLGI